MNWRAFALHFGLEEEHNFLTLLFLKTWPYFEIFKCKYKATNMSVRTNTGASRVFLMPKHWLIHAHDMVPMS